MPLKLRCRGRDETDYEQRLIARVLQGMPGVAGNEHSGSRTELYPLLPSKGAPLAGIDELLVFPGMDVRRYASAGCQFNETHAIILSSVRLAEKDSPGHLFGSPGKIRGFNI
jgi:hypothetical protein